MTEKIYSPIEVAELLDVGEVTVWRWCRRRGLGRKVRGRWEITAGELRIFRKNLPKPGRPPGKTGGNP
jgi:hypothetical protein